MYAFIKVEILLRGGGGGELKRTTIEKQKGKETTAASVSEQGLLTVHWDFEFNTSSVHALIIHWIRSNVSNLFLH